MTKTKQVMPEEKTYIYEYLIFINYTMKSGMTYTQSYHRISTNRLFVLAAQEINNEVKKDKELLGAFSYYISNIIQNRLDSPLTIEELDQL